MQQAFRKHAPRTIVVAALSIAHGCLGASIVAQLVSILSSQHVGIPRVQLALLIATGCGSIVTRYLGSTWSAGIANEIIRDVRVEVCSRMLAMPLARQEQSGGHRLVQMMSADVEHVAVSALVLPLLMANASLVVGSVGYIASRNPVLGAGVVAIFVFGGLIYAQLMRHSKSLYVSSRELQTKLHGCGRDVVDGRKELKMSAGTSRRMLAENVIPLADACRAASDLNAKAHATGMAGWGAMSIGTLAAIAAWNWGASGPEALGFVLAIVYAKTSFQGLLDNFPYLLRGIVAMREMVEQETDSTDADEAESGTDASYPAVGDVRLRGVSYRYDGSLEAIGPVNASFRPGTVTFLVGGNGTGKSTFLKMLCGLYAPESGDILIDGARLTSRAAWRESIAAVFSDFHLPRYAKGLLPIAAAQDHPLLDRFALRDLLPKLDDGTERDALPMSQGQQRRLAILLAVLRDAPVFVFDEPTSDLDGPFRHYFYHELVPSLKARGKIVVVATHDEHFFDLADAIVRFDDDTRAVAALGPRYDCGTVP